MIPGNVHVAAHFVAQVVNEASGWGLTAVHLTALTLTEKDPAPKYQARQLLKKPNGFRTITPLHMAAANPNPTAFFAFNKVAPAHTAIADSVGRFPIHFAAANANPKILEALLEQVCVVKSLRHHELTLYRPFPLDFNRA